MAVISITSPVRRRTRKEVYLNVATTTSLVSWLLLMLPCCPDLAKADTDFGDAVISNERTLRLRDSPYLVTEDVLVKPSGKLTIEPGVEVRFMPEVGITVRGVLKAQGTVNKKIKFVPAEDVDERQPNRTIRLVDGPNVNEGIIQILDLGSWRSVCTNSRNWTQTDMEVACKQLGFQGGEWHHWYPHLNDTRQMLYQEPGKLHKPHPFIHAAAIKKIEPLKS